MVQYSPLFVVINALLFAMWAVTFCYTLVRRFSMPVTILGFAIQYLIWLIPPYFMGNGSILRAVYPLFAIVLPLFLLFHDKWYRILFVSLVSMVFMYVADLIPSAIIFTPAQLHEGLALQPLPQRLVAYAICVSLDAFLLWMLVLFMNRYKNRLHGSEWVLYLLFPFSQYLLLFGWLRVSLSEMTFPRAGYVIAAKLVCVAADAALYIAVRGMAQRSELKAKTTFFSRKSTGRRSIMRLSPRSMKPFAACGTISPSIFIPCRRCCNLSAIRMRRHTQTKFPRRRRYRSIWESVKTRSSTRICSRVRRS